MDCQKKKITAAVSAVLTYIKSQEEMAAVQAAGMPSAAEMSPAASPIPVRLWGQSGRQYQMQLRNLMQMRTFHGSRLR